MTARSNYARLASLCETLSWVTRYWWLFVLLFSLVSPVSPHLRLTSAERTSCAYLGVHGIIYEAHEFRCPLFGLIETTGRGQW
ncbi:MAG: hypothetical protein ACQRW7_07310 [Caulobacterales bacterium]|uniref:hypothetical protein n=1 Tax=Glycocaulis sp. TaxID=1969725 RepID=UPI003FA16DF4